MLRHILLGIGVTLLVISLVLIAGGLLPAAPSNSQLTEEELINRARKLGMEFPGANYTQGITLESGVNLKNSLQQKEKEETTEEVEKDVKEKEKTTEEEQAAKEKMNPESEVKNDTQQEKITVTITEGMQGWEVADLLTERGIVENRTVFINLLQKFDIEKKIMAGEYEFKPGVSKLEVLLAVTSG